MVRWSFLEKSVENLIRFDEFLEENCIQGELEMEREKKKFIGKKLCIRTGDNGRFLHPRCTPR